MNVGIGDWRLENGALVTVYWSLLCSVLTVKFFRVDYD
jgi:hypothetical protein